ncbi:MAG TPA: DoxX family protein [Longimicrobiales bacterium]|nr:DoxX family protein [Longimicrobiales bacterium]
MSTPETASPSAAPAGIGLRAAIWGAQVLVFVALVLSGVMKLTWPIPQLAEVAPWTGDVPAAFVRFIACIELAGAAGILLPSLTRIRPGLTIVAAYAVGLLMLFAIVFHTIRGDGMTGYATPMVLLWLSGLVAWGRWRRAPIRSR